MEKLFPENETLANKISYCHLMLFMASLPFDIFYSHLILISLAAHTLIQLRRASIKPFFTTRNLVLQSVFLITIFSTIYTINKPEAFKEWGEQLAILIFPFLFCFNQLDIKKYKSRLLLAFSVICTATVSYLYVDAFIIIRHYGLPYQSILSASFVNHNFSAPIAIHATFFSLQLAVALIYMLSVLLKKQSNASRVMYAICVCILVAGIIQLSAKSVFAALLLVINLAMPYFLLQGKTRIHFLWFSVSLSVLIVGVIFTSSILKARYITDFDYDLSRTSIHRIFDSRVNRWHAAATLIEKSPVIGHGAGSEMGLLHEEFYIEKYYNSFLNNLNAHSQYLSFLIKSGIIGLLIYLGTLAFGFKVAWQNKDLIFFAVMLLICFVSVSENMLDVDKGVMFYAFFFSFFMFSTGEKDLAGRSG